MNEFLIQSLIEEAAAQESGQRTRHLISRVAEQCALSAEEHSPAAAWAIRQQFVNPTATDAALAARLAVLTANPQ